MTDEEKLNIVAKGIATLPLRIVCGGKNTHVTSITTSSPLPQFVLIDDVPYETFPVSANEDGFRYKVRPSLKSPDQT